VLQIKKNIVHDYTRTRRAYLHRCVLIVLALGDYNLRPPGYQPVQLWVYSVGGGLVSSVGVYNGRVSTESGPRCPRFGMVHIGASGVMLGVLAAGNIDCGGPVARSVQLPR